MSRKDLSEFRGLSPVELREKIEKLKEAQYECRLKFRLGQLKDTSAQRRHRRDIARLMTILAEKEKPAGNDRGQKR